MFTGIIKELFIWRKKSLDKQLLSLDKLQEELLSKIIIQNKSVPYLQQFNINNYSDFQKKCPPVVYDDIEEIILKIKSHHINELTTEKIIAFSKSSGTTSRSKLIPMTKHGLNANFTAGKNIVSNFLAAYPNSKLVSGKNFSLTGSYHIDNSYVVGDVSALFTYFLKPWYRPFRSPSKKIATLANWDEKLTKMTPILAKEDIRWIAGVPSWMAIVIDNIEAYTQKPITEVWKNLEVFFYGGVNIEPFRTYFDTKFNKNLKLWQTYNASEGFFGIQTQSDSTELSFLYDTENYYEFIPKSEIDSTSPHILSRNELIIGGIYELIITNSSGLYRYRMGDLIQITDIIPLRYQVVGRTKNYINIFGEELMVANTEAAISRMTSEFNIQLKDYTVAPIIDGHKGYHRWMIEFETTPNDISEFEIKLDGYLRELNSDYDAKRFNDYILQPLKITILPKDSFSKWLEYNQRKNVQSKIPKLVNNSSVQDSITAILGL
jgi:hypothetical protein